MGALLGDSEYLEQAGADALELNIFDVPADPNITSEHLETRYCDLVRTIRKRVHISIAVKLGPYFTSCANFARKLSNAGADGIVIFNRFYQPDFDLEELGLVPNLVLSSPHELRLRLHWAAILYRQVETDIAITGGVHDFADVLKSMMAGADVAMMTSALLTNGIEHIGIVLAGMKRWMEEHEYVSVRQRRGSMSLVNVEDPTAYLRGNYLKTLGCIVGESRGQRWRLQRAASLHQQRTRQFKQMRPPRAILREKRSLLTIHRVGIPHNVRT